MIRIRSLAVLSGLFLLFPSFGHADDPSPRTGALQTLLGIPTDMAVVTDGYVPKGQALLHYVLIEDVHASPESQGKIAAILLYGHHHWGSRQAFVEGAFGTIGPPPFPIYTAERGDRGVTELLRQGLFSAGELAAALSSRSGGLPLIVKGMDDPLLYRRQLEVFEDLASLRTRAIEQLENESSHLTAGQRHCLQRLLELRMTPEDYRQYLWMVRPSFDQPDLARAVDQAETYYRLTELRSMSFARTTRARIGNGPCLLVMGGFHTSRVARMLKEREESFIVLSPHLMEGVHPEVYEERLAKTFQMICRVPYDSPSSSAAGLLSLSLARQRE